MMEKLLKNKFFWLLLFLSLFGFSIGVFDNYRELWMQENGLSTSSISHVIGISYLVTVLILFFFTIKISINKIKKGIIISLAIKITIESILVFLNNSNELFWIKFLMFFDIAFTQLIVASIYPLMMNLTKDDILYTKKNFVESLSSKFGFLCVSYLLGKIFFNRVFNYNTCLWLAIIFSFLAFIVLVFIKFLNSKKNSSLNIKETIKYFNNNKSIYLYFVHNLMGSLIWSTILGMPLLVLTTKLNFSSNIASYMILGLGIISNFLSMLIVKKLRFKNDHLNIFFKYGMRIVLYFLVLMTNKMTIFLLTIIYLLLTDCPYEFIFSGYFINNVSEKYTLLLTVLKYCTALIGNAVGVFVCGLVFNLELRYFILPAFILASIHYLVAYKLVDKRKNLVRE